MAIYRKNIPIKTTAKYGGHQRKFRQLKLLVKQLKRYLNETCFSCNIEALIQKAKRLVGELQQVCAAWQLRKILGGISLLVGLSISNSASAQNFGPKQQNPFGLNNVNYNSNPTFVDLDGDGDLDLMVGEFYSNFKYFENTGTASAPAYGAAQQNPFGLAPVYYHASPAFADLDNDGDMDMISCEQYGDLQYFENVGTASAPNFTTTIANPYGLSYVNTFGFPTFGDLDGDGDNDLLVGEKGGNFQYFQNVGSASAMSFTTAVPNPFGLTPLGTGSNAVAAAHLTDIDGDGDLDMMGTDAGGDFKYFENIGTPTVPNFASVLTNPFNLTSLGNYAMMSFADLDGDGDKDLMAGDYDGNLNYFERILPMGIKSEAQLVSSSVDIYPNPASESIQVKCSWADFVDRVEIIDLTGKTCVLANVAGRPINIKDLAAGIYSVKIVHQNGSIEVKRLQKH